MHRQRMNITIYNTKIRGLVIWCNEQDKSLNPEDGKNKYHGLTLRKGLILDLCLTFFLDIRFVTMRGYLSIPAIRAWPKGLSEVPSSLGFTMIALRPANLPDSTRTTLPCFIILPILAWNNYFLSHRNENL